MADLSGPHKPVTLKTPVEKRKLLRRESCQEAASTTCISLVRLVLGSFIVQCATDTKLLLVPHEKVEPETGPEATQERSKHKVESKVKYYHPYKILVCMCVCWGERGGLEKRGGVMKVVS